MKYLKLASRSIKNFSINESEYELLTEPNSLNIECKGEGNIFVKSKNIKAKLAINFRDSSGSKVFIGNNVTGNINIFFQGNDSIVYIGSGCGLNNLTIRSFQNNDLVAVGNGVTTTAKNTWISGLGAGQSKPAIVIGDDCMFAYDIVLRNSDAHPIYSLSTEKQLNEPLGAIHIEPHVWVGEQVSILKSVTVGANSIIALGSTVTKDIPRFSIAKGSPAKFNVNPDLYWSRNSSEKARNVAKNFIDKYKSNTLSN